MKQMTQLDVYLKSDYEPDAEYVDGEIEERPKREYDHAAWQGAIFSWFRKHSKEWNIRVVPELRVQVTASRFRVPDVAVLGRDLAKTGGSWKFVDGQLITETEFRQRTIRFAITEIQSELDI
jgi:hypothetical protein